MHDDGIEQLLAAWEAGDHRAFDQLTTLLYPQLKSIAQRQFARERAGHTLQPTALVNEAFLRLREAGIGVKDTDHLRGVIAFTMRRVLVDHARRRSRDKRGGQATFVTYRDEQSESGEQLLDVVAIDEALDELAGFDALSAEILCCHYFGGMTYAEIARALGKSESTVHAKLRTARAWLSTRSAT